jgi:hypothetical protein
MESASNGRGFDVAEGGRQRISQWVIGIRYNVRKGKAGINFMLDSTANRSESNDKERFHEDEPCFTKSHLRAGNDASKLSFAPHSAQCCHHPGGE